MSIQDPLVLRVTMLNRFPRKDCLTLLANVKPLYQKCNIKTYNVDAYAKELRGSDLRRILAMRNYLLSRSPELPFALENQLIQRLLSDRSLVDRAFQISKKMLTDGSYPSPNILKKLISVISDEGRLDWLRDIKDKLPLQLIQDPWFTNKVVFTYINADKADDLVRNVLPTMRPFPAKSLTTLLLKYPSHEKQIEQLALSMCKPPENMITPLNSLWLYYMMSRKFFEANNILLQSPKLREKLDFSTILEEVRSNCDVEMARQLTDLLIITDLSPRSVALGYSALIDVLIDQDKYDQAEQVVLSMEKETADRVHSQTGEKITPVTIAHINRVTAIRLMNKIVTVVKREARFDLPHREN